MVMVTGNRRNAQRLIIKTSFFPQDSRSFPWQAGDTAIMSDVNGGKIMKNIGKFAVIAGAAMLAAATPAQAQLEPYADYELSDAVWSISTVKVDANMGEYYLEGLRSTWIASNEVAKELGHIEDYSIYGSDFPQSGDFNMLLIVKFANTADLAPNKAKYDAFMQKWGETKVKESRQISKDLYPTIRTITGDYLMRKIDVK